MTRSVIDNENIKIFREIASCRDLLKGLCTIGNSLVETHKRSKGTCLLSEEGIYNNTIVKTVKSINLDSFHGRVSQFHVSSE